MTHKQSALLAIRRREMGAFLLGARIAAACATLLLVCLLAQQVLGIELGGVVGTSILVLPLLALAFVLWETVPLALAKKPKFPPGLGRKGRTASSVDPRSFEPRSTSEPPRQRPRR
ncbi:hypothetical protein [Xanthomonas citri]|uniref:hypothetical protein n=2 Tax=Xanthomonas citri TaxID=346 RepID=UPI0001CEC6BE|nr:hypothetical protein [Xanthomonas citri]AMV08682.1 hypothetical protein AC028_19130 [Xanthomonas citri pv. aurantifolii]ARE57077.1 hypothetical protein TP45_12550 [Xanthomonas citri pv. aurantifolii]EFF45348.1 hypothetical protein XAUB_05410 [Xanthomonas citri pv. aurantifolii str. ICPB 11122]